MFALGLFCGFVIGFLLNCSVVVFAIWVCGYKIIDKDVYNYLKSKKDIK